MASVSLRAALGVLLLGAGACSSPDRADLDSAALGIESPQLRASKWVKLWSDLPKDHGTKAHYRACEGEAFRFTLSFRNMGSAIWRDEPGRGDAVGSDVFLETASGKPDRLTGKPRYSLRWNANDWVRGDRKAKECTMNRGCRRTRAIHDGIAARAPAAPGVYRSRWRLRDYSKAWSSAQGFGPKAELRVRVEHCPGPGECACKVECSDGSRTTLWLSGGSDSACKSQADLFCLPFEATVHQFEACTPPPDGGAGGHGGTGSGGAGSAGGVNAEDPPDGPGFWITDADLPAGGAGGSGAPAAPAAGGGATTTTRASAPTTCPTTRTTSPTASTAWPKRFTPGRFPSKTAVRSPGRRDPRDMERWRLCLPWPRRFFGARLRRPAEARPAPRPCGARC